MAWGWPPAGSSSSGCGVDNGASALSPREGSLGCWDLTDAPVLLAGSNGSIHETRPTTSLARDLADAEAKDDRGPLPIGAGYAFGGGTSPSAGRKAPPERPLRADPDERPLRGVPQQSESASSSSSACRSPGGGYTPSRPSTADRPIGGFGFGNAGSASSSAGTSNVPVTKRRSSTGSFTSVASHERRASTGAVRSTSPGSSGVPITRDAKPPSVGSVCGTERRRSLRPYAPIDALLNMGFDEDSARAAIAAAGGDVDRAVRMVLEDSRAHDAMSLCEWEFEGDMGWVPFDGETDRILKEAADRGDTACEIRAGGHRYLIDFDSLTQFNLASQRTRRIRRRNASVK